MIDNPSVSRAREIVLAHGWNSTSFQLVNPGIELWFAPAGDAVVGYVSTAGFRVVAGAPACTADRLPQVVDEFEAEAASAGHEVCYFAAESRLEAVAAASGRHSKFLIGAQPSWNPAGWSAIIDRHKSLRAQLNRARNKGVAVEEWPAERARDNPLLQRCLSVWLASKGLPPLHFMVEPDTLSRVENRRVFVAMGAAAVVGFVMLSPVGPRRGWLFEQFPHVPEAPNGTVELMVDTAMRAIAADDCRYATLGLSPLSKRAAVAEHSDPLWLMLLLGWLRRHGSRFYNFKGLDRFKAKFQPGVWEPIFVVCNRPKVSAGALYAVASAFSAGHPFRLLFGGLGRAAATEARRGVDAVGRLFARD